MQLTPSQAEDSKCSSEEKLRTGVRGDMWTAREEPRSGHKVDAICSAHEEQNC